MKQEERIRKMEELLDTALEAVSEMSAAMGKYAEAQDAISTLDGYYGSREWKQDCEADESGKLPATLKRGILSQDGIWNMLADVRELNDAIVRMAEKLK